MIENLREKLTEYLELSHDELTEVGHLLVQLSTYPDYISDQCLAAIADEMRLLLEDYRLNYKIVEKEVVENRIVRELVYKEEK